MVDTAVRRRILVVEDEPGIARLLQRYLEAMGFDVHAESTGLAALAYVRVNRPDLILLDLRLPDLHGYEVCKELRRSHPSWELPILMLTSLDAPLDRVRGYAYGADAYVTKPFEPPELLPNINLLLGKMDSLDCAEPPDQIEPA